MDNINVSPATLMCILFLLSINLQGHLTHKQSITGIGPNPVKYIFFVVINNLSIMNVA